MIAALFVGYGRLRTEMSLLKGITAVDEGGARAGLDDALARDGRNVYALYEELRMSMERPAEALALAERIEGIIPGFRETRLLAGSAQAMAGDYAGAAASLRLFLGQNLISPPAYARLIACEAMLAHPAAVAEAIEGFFIWMHKYYMRNRGDYFELEERELRILPSGESARSYHDSDKNISELGGRYLARVAQVLVAKRPGDFLSAYVSANLALGGLLDELDYSDAGLAFYADALSSSRLDLGSGGADRGQVQGILR